MTQEEYFNNVLIKEIGDVVERHPFLSFGLITSAIELLGVCMDKENPFFQPGNSGKRFRSAIHYLFPLKYQFFNDFKNTKVYDYDLYTELRCGLCHGTIPKLKIGLSERKHNTQHLSIRGDGMLVLVAEDFFDDFKNACNKVIKMVKNSEIKERFNINLV